MFQCEGDEWHRVAIVVVELLLRLWAIGCGPMLRDAMSVFDMLVVVGTMVDLIMTRLLAIDGALNLSVARLDAHRHTHTHSRIANRL
eukprot:2089470-Amphidinium_carterae.1